MTADKGKGMISQEEVDAFVDELEAILEAAKERSTCSVCLARTYRGNEECVCEDGGDAEDYDGVLAELGGPQ